MKLWQRGQGKPGIGPFNRLAGSAFNRAVLPDLAAPDLMQGDEFEIDAAMLAGYL